MELSLDHKFLKYKIKRKPSLWKEKCYKQNIYLLGKKCDHLASILLACQLLVTSSSQEEGITLSHSRDHVAMFFKNFKCVVV